MNISRKWLSDYVALNCDDATLCDKLTMSGIEVEAVEAGSKVPAGVVAAKILERGKHPDSDHLSVCKVFDGKETLQIVCGAPNCDAGKIVPLATIGTVFSTPEGEFKIKRSKLRGVESFGMMCSASELGIGEDNSGLLILPEDTVPGTPLAALYPGDTQIEVEVTPNRPDWLSMYGIARDVACLLDEEAHLPESTVPECRTPAPGLVTVEDPDLCPRYIGRIIRNVKIGPSPAWMVERLESIGLRSINNVVDVTNFVMMELGQPLHVFDLDKLEGKRVVARRAKAGESIVTLDGKKLDLTPNNLVIADAAKPMALAGIMGGEYSGVSDGTVNVLLESACFKSSNIRTASRKLGISSDSSYRFERGVDYEMTPVAAMRAAQLILATAGGELASEAVDVAAGREPDAVICCRFDRIRSLIGTQVSNERIVEILQKLHLGVDKITAESCEVTSRSFRRDVSREADLAEEVARINGLGQIPEVPVSGKCAMSIAEDTYYRLANLRDFAVRLGFCECVHYTIVGSANALTDGRFEEKDLVTLSNPLSADASVLRCSLFGGMMGAVERNLARGNRDLRLFELGKVFCATGEKFPEERYELMLLLSGRRHPELYSAAAAETFDFYDLKGAVETLMELCGVSTRRYRMVKLENDRRFRPGRAAALEIDGKRVGALGEIAENLSAKWRNNAPVFTAQIEAAALWNVMGREKIEYKDLAQFPGTTRDVAFIAPESLEHGAIAAFIAKCKPANLESVRLFDIFVDDALKQAGRKSMAYTLTFRHRERTLKDAEVNSTMDQLRAKLAADLKVELR